MSHVWMTSWRVMSHMSTSHVTNVSVWRHTHINKTRVTLASKSSDTCKWVMLHIWMSHVSQMKVSSHTHVTFVDTVRFVCRKERCITNTHMECLQYVGFLDCYVSFDEWASYNKALLQQSLSIQGAITIHHPHYHTWWRRSKGCLNFPAKEPYVVLLCRTLSIFVTS